MRIQFFFLNLRICKARYLNFYLLVEIKFVCVSLNIFYNIIIHVIMNTQVKFYHHLRVWFCINKKTNNTDLETKIWTHIYFLKKNKITEL